MQSLVIRSSLITLYKTTAVINLPVIKEATGKTTNVIV